MGKQRRTVQIIILTAVLLLGGYAIGSTLFTSEASSVLKTGSKPPEFKLADLQGNTHELAQYEGRPIIINFWGTFCPPCVKEMPEFERQYVKWKDEGLVILAINLSEDTLSVDNFVRRFDLSYTILRDINRKVERSYGLRSYPTTFFVRPDGSLMEVFVGGMTEKQIDERVERLLHL